MKNTVNNTMTNHYDNWGIYGYTEKERVMLVDAHRGYGLHYFQFIKASEADNIWKFFDPIRNLYEAICQEGLEERKEVIAMGDYCIVLISWKWKKPMKGGMLELMYKKANNLENKK